MTPLPIVSGYVMLINAKLKSFIEYSE